MIFEGAPVTVRFSAILNSKVTALCFSQTAGNPQPTQPQTMSRPEATGTIAASRKIVSQNGVEELLPLQINGITQWVSIRGRDRRNPVLLFLHGGPGSPTMPEDYTCFAGCPRSRWFCETWEWIRPLRPSWVLPFPSSFRLTRRGCCPRPGLATAARPGAPGAAYIPGHA